MIAGLGCLLDPFGCAADGIAAWFHSIPLIWLLLAAFIAGQAFGAKFGWWGVIATWTAGIALLVMRVRDSGDTPAENVDGPDAAPPHRKRKPKPAKPQPESWIDFVRRGDKAD